MASNVDRPADRCACRCGRALPPHPGKGRKRLYLPGHRPETRVERQHAQAAVSHPGCRADLDALLPAWEAYCRLHGLTGDDVVNVLEPDGVSPGRQESVTDVSVEDIE